MYQIKFVMHFLFFCSIMLLPIILCGILASKKFKKIKEKIKNIFLSKKKK